jgi:hypothetical protein
MRIVFVYFISLFLLNACKEKTTGNPRVIIETAYGDVELLLYQDKAPITTKARKPIFIGYYICIINLPMRLNLC